MKTLKFLMSLICAVLISHTAFNQTLNIHILNLKNTKGVLRLAFFCNQNEFDCEKPLFSRVIDKSKIKNHQFHFKLKIKPGTYAISALDDENNDAKMNYRFHLPIEGYGFSNYIHHGIKKPRFPDFSFTIKNKAYDIFIKMQYF